MEKVKVGILGAGHIAHAMASTIIKMNEVELYCVAARELQRAQEFAKQYSDAKAYGSYEEMVKDEAVELIYIATPHSHHYEHMKLCLQHGKNVLCEKAFTANARQAEEVIQMAESKSLLLAEAMWVRYMPMAAKLKEIVDAQVIGNISMVTANLHFPMLHKERLIKPGLAGGALLDVGIYPLTIASMVLGDDVEKVNATGVLTDAGVDATATAAVVYKDKKMAVLDWGMTSFSDGKAVIYGDKGFLVVTGVNNIQSIEVFDHTWNKVQGYEREKQITGYEYEVSACVEMIREHKTECPQMTHKQTMKMMEMMDEIRKQLKVIYPFD